MGKYFTEGKSVGSRLVKALEHTHECCIEVRPGSGSARGSWGPERGATASAIEKKNPEAIDDKRGDNPVRVEKGDIVRTKVQ